MGPVQLRRTDERNRPRAQARCLTELLASRDLSAREVARRSAVIAEEMGRPEFSVGHQAVSAWLNGTRHPTPKHQQVLAMIIGVPVADIILACDEEAEASGPRLILRQTTVVVPSTFQEYRYNLALKKEINLDQPAIYSDWKDMFSFPPTRIMRHLRNIRAESFGWIPDNSANPLIHYPRCLVPMERMPNRRTLQSLDSAESSQRRVWFVYLPGGRLQVGIGYRRNRSFALARNEGNRLVVREFPLSRVDLVGHFRGNIVFYFLPTNTGDSTALTSAQNGVANGGGKD